MKSLSFGFPKLCHYSEYIFMSRLVNRFRLHNAVIKYLQVTNTSSFINIEGNKDGITTKVCVYENHKKDRFKAEILIRYQNKSIAYEEITNRGLFANVVAYGTNIEIYEYTLNKLGWITRKPIYLDVIKHRNMKEKVVYLNYRDPEEENISKTLLWTINDGKAKKLLLGDRRLKRALNKVRKSKAIQEMNKKSRIKHNRRLKRIHKKTRIHKCMMHYGMEEKFAIKLARVLKQDFDIYSIKDLYTKPISLIKLRRCRGIGDKTIQEYIKFNYKLKQIASKLNTP